MKTAISPKVHSSAIGGVLLGALVAALGAITLPMLSFLGDFAPVGLAFLTAAGTYLGAVVAGYWVSDPIRDIGVSVLAGTAPAEPAPVAEPAVEGIPTGPAPALDEATLGTTVVPTLP